MEQTVEAIRKLFYDNINENPYIQHVEAGEVAAATEQMEVILETLGEMAKVAKVEMKLTDIILAKPRSRESMFNWMSFFAGKLSGCVESNKKMAKENILFAIGEAFTLATQDGITFSDFKKKKLLGIKLTKFEEAYDCLETIRDVQTSFDKFIEEDKKEEAKLQLTGALYTVRNIAKLFEIELPEDDVKKHSSALAGCFVGLDEDAYHLAVTLENIENKTGHCNMNGVAYELKCMLGSVGYMAHEARIPFTEKEISEIFELDAKKTKAKACCKKGLCGTTKCLCSDKYVGDDKKGEDKK